MTPQQTMNAYANNKGLSIDVVNQLVALTTEENKGELFILVDTLVINERDIELRCDKAYESGKIDGYDDDDDWAR